MVLADGVANSGYGKREVARAGRSAISPAAEIFTARLAAGLAITALYLGALAMLPLDPARRAVLSASAVFFLGYAAFPDWMARGLEAFRALALAHRPMAAGLAAPCRRVPRSAPRGRRVWGGSFFLGAALLIPGLVRDGGFRFRAALPVGEMRRHLARSAVFSIGAIGAMGITHLPTILLAALAPPEELALFVAAFRVVITCVGVGSIAWWPFYSALSAAPPGGEAFTQAFRAFLVLMLGASLPLRSGCGCSPPTSCRPCSAQYAAAVPLCDGSRGRCHSTGW